MPKKIILLSFILGICTISFAQLKYELKVGFTQSFIKESIASTYQDMKLKSGVQIGVSTNITLIKNLVLRPSIQLTQKGYKAVEGNFDGPFYWDRNASISYLELPIDVVYKFPLTKSTKIFIGTGPVLSVGLFGSGKGIVKATDGSGQLYTQESSGNKPFQKLGYTRLDLGADFLAGIQLHRVVIAANYNHGLTNILNYDHGVQTTKNRSFAFTVGYSISK